MVKRNYTTAVKNYKKKWWKLLLIDFLFLSLLAGFVSFSRYLIRKWLTEVLNILSMNEAYLTSITEAGQISYDNLLLILNNIGPIVNRLNWFMFFIVPLVTLILWAFSHSLIYSFIQGKKIQLKKFGQYLFLTLPFCVTSFVLVYFLFFFRSEDIRINLSGLIIFVIIGLLLFHFLNCLYSMLYLSDNVWRDIKKSFIFGFKKMHKLLLFSFVMSFLWFFIFGILIELVILLTRFKIVNFFLLSILFIIVLLCMGFMRTFYTIYLQKMVDDRVYKRFTKIK